MILDNYFFGKLQILLNHGFPRPILATQHISLRSGCFKGKIVFGALDKVKFLRKVVVNNYSGLQQKLFPGQVEFSS